MNVRYLNKKHFTILITVILVLFFMIVPTVSADASVSLKEPEITEFDVDTKVVTMAEEGEYEYYAGIITDDILTDASQWTSFSDTLDLSELLSVDSDPVVSIRKLNDDSTVEAAYVSITPGAVPDLSDSDSDFSESQILVMVSASDLADENDKMLQEESELFYGVEIDELEILMDSPAAAQGDDSGQQVVLLTLKDSSRDNVVKAVEQLTLNAEIEYAEPDYVMQLREEPNDTYYSYQYSMPKISAPDAWDITTGSSSVVVGVIDTGIDYSHPDLAANMWMNPGEIAGDGIDNDGNGYIDDVYGWNFADKNNDVMDGNGHGTHVAGIIGAVGNNSMGVTGVCWNVKLAAIKIMDSKGYATLSGIIEAIQYAKDMGIDITNNSWGVTIDSPLLKNAIDSYDGLFVCAVTNDAERDVDVSPSYPECYGSECDEILSVANSNSNDVIISGYGKNTVHLAAPGTGIYSTYPTSLSTELDIRGYKSKTGTSMAAPLVTGTAALLRSVDPDLTTGEIKEIILNSVDPVSGMSSQLITGGRLNVYKAVSQIADLPAPPTGVTVSVASASSLKVSWTKATGVSGYVIWYATSENGKYKKIDKVSGTSYTHKNLAAGTTYYYKIRSYNTISGKEQYSDYTLVKYKKLTVPTPTNVKTSKSSAASIKISWNKVGDASGYVIYRSTSKNGTYTKLTTIKSGSTVSYTNKGLANNKTYYYKIRAYKTINGSNKYSGYTDIAARALLAKPGDLKLTNSSATALKISWKKVSGASGYEIYRAASKNGSYNKVKTVTSGTAVSYTDKGLTNNKTYYYKVRAYKNVIGSKNYSSFSSAITKKVSLTKPTLSASAKSSSSIKLSWKKVSGATGYEIYRSASQNGSYKKIKTVSNLTFTDKSLKSGKTYFYKIKAIQKTTDKTYRSSNSGIKKATTK